MPDKIKIESELICKQDAIDMLKGLIIMGCPDYNQAVNDCIKILTEIKSINNINAMVNDLISRQAVLDLMRKRDEELSSICPKDIRALPPVIPQPKTGRWIYNKKEDSYKCSLCGFPCHKDNLGAIPTEYCAGCGAKMEE